MYCFVLTLFVKTLNLEISRCYLAGYVNGSTFVRAARAARLFFIIQLAINRFTRD